MASIITLGYEELKEIEASDSLPEGVTLDGIEGHKDFAKLFAARQSPALMAKLLLKDMKPVKPKREATYVSVVPQEVTERRLALKAAELELKRERKNSTTESLQSSSARIESMSKRIDVLVQSQLSMTDRLDTILARLDLAISKLKA